MCGNEGAAGSEWHDVDLLDVCAIRRKVLEEPEALESYDPI